jgi:transcriptional regulator with GAF, ATPase, and Fis domain
MLTGPESQRDIHQLVADVLLSAIDGAIARVWVPGPGDSCATCTMRPECPDQTTCLHLVASAGLSTKLDGPFRRFPIGAREVGRVPLTLEPFTANEALGALGLAEPAWVMAHDVRAFVAAPITRDGRCLGVMAAFSRAPIEARELGAIDSIAALAARALTATPGRGTTAPAADTDDAEHRLPRAKNAPAMEAPSAAQTPQSLELLRAWDDIERDVLERVLAHTGGRVSGAKGAAAILRMKPTTLQSRLKKLGARRPRA